MFMNSYKATSYSPDEIMCFYDLTSSPLHCKLEKDAKRLWLLFPSLAEAQDCVERVNGLKTAAKAQLARKQLEVLTDAD